LTNAVTPNEFSDILSKSKICISPWGHCEICGRDSQGLMHDCVTIHPRTQMETWPDVWADGIQCESDFSDLGKIVEKVLDSWGTIEETTRKIGAKWREFRSIDVLSNRIRGLLESSVC